MIYLLIAAAALTLLVLILKKHARILDTKRAIDWAQTKDAAVASPTAESVPESGAAPAEEVQGESEAPAPQIDFNAMSRAFRVADMHFSRGKFDEAEKHFIKVLSYNEHHPEALNRLGVIYIQKEDLRRAELLFKKLLDLKPKEAAYYCNYGRCLYNQQRFEEAIEAYVSAIELEPKRPSRYVSVGQIYYEMKNFEKALEHFVKALELSPQNMEYLHIVAELAELMGDAARLETTLKKIALLDPYNEEIKKKLEGMSEGTSK